MKSFRSVLVTGLVALLPVVSFQLNAAPPLTIAPARETLYVKLESPDLIEFSHFRRALVDGSELVLATLKSSAADQARFAGYTGALVVLDDKAEAPAGAPVLLLTWNDHIVSATLQRDGREKSIGVVSRTPLSDHPDYATMRRQLDRGLPEQRRDEYLRAQTQMQLYQALRILHRYEEKA